jgi:hypothetical protein
MINVNILSRRWDKKQGVSGYLFGLENLTTGFYEANFLSKWLIFSIYLKTALRMACNGIQNLKLNKKGDNYLEIFRDLNSTIDNFDKYSPFTFSLLTALNIFSVSCSS